MEAVDQGEVGVGAQLRAAREARQLGLGDVAERLKLSVRQLEAIERDDYAALPGETFARGFVRNYARFLELDPTPLMRQLDVVFPPPPPVELVEADTAAEATPVRSALPRVLLGGAVVLAVVIGVAWLSQGEDEPASGALAPMAIETATSSAPVPSGIVDAPDAAMASTPAQDTPVASAPAPAEAAVPPADVSEPAPAAAPATVAAATAGDLRLSSDQDAWVSVTDAKGQKLMFGTLKAGEEKVLAGVAPYRIRIGNATRVKLYYKGQPVDLAGQIRGSTATIKLD